MYKIFINDKPLILTDDINYYREAEYSILLKFDTTEGLLLAVEALESQEKVESLFVVHDDLAYLWEAFSSNYTIIEAAGGMVKNPKDEILFIHRLNKWDLPKGKIKEGENPEKAAIREVEEECGISELSIIKLLPPTYHTYTRDNKKLLKKTYWFEMYYKGDNRLKPQAEEEIKEAKWFSENEINNILDNTYNSIRELVDLYIG
ncbi:MAG: NUDIX hydrolase [Bacteroidota bacterium]